MKVTRSCSILFILLTISEITAAESRHFTIIPDSVYTYSYNRDNSQYELASITYNYYQNGILDSIINTTIDRMPVSKIVYFYQEGLLSSLRTYSFNEDKWLPVQKQDLYYNDYERLSTRNVTVWRADGWENLNTFTYNYDEADNLIVYHRDYWKNDEWTDFSDDSLFYDESGYLTERRAILSSGQYVTRMIYNYTSTGLKFYQIRQDYKDSEWVNNTRTYFAHNSCGIQTSNYVEKWLNGAWGLDSKSEIFYHYEIAPRVRKVPVCYERQTIFIMTRLLDQYLANGACLGECIEPGAITEPDAMPAYEMKSSEKPFVVYPNPATDYVSIKLTNHDCPVTTVELLDYSGRLVRRIAVEGDELITLDLGSMKSGNYILRVNSDTVYSTVLSKK